MRVTLSYLEARTALAPTTALAKLRSDDVDFVLRHIKRLRDEASAADALLSRFQTGADVPHLLKELADGTEDRFLEISTALATRLQASMDQATRPNPGVLALVSTSQAESDAQSISILKLDAVGEAAQLLRRGAGVQLRVLKRLLPAPGALQKGISWPDVRARSDAIVIDRNPTTALYFFNAYQLRVSPTPIQAERALAKLIVQQMPREERARAVAVVDTESGPAEDVIRRLRGQFPDFQAEVPELGAAGSVGGYIRRGKVAPRTRFVGDGIEVLVPQDRINRVNIDEVGGGYLMTIRFDSRPEEGPG